MPAGKKAIGWKWVHQIKPKFMVVWIDSKLVLWRQVYNQVVGINYFDSFSPIAKLLIVQLFLATTSGKSWPIHQFDINNAFFSWSFEWKRIYVASRRLFQSQNGEVCKPKWSFHWLKQVSRQTSLLSIKSWIHY